MRARSFWTAFAGLLLAAQLASGASAQTSEKRVALVIGNAAYKEAPLRNPVNDARAMAAKLRSLGFDVVSRENATRQGMEAALSEFTRKLRPGSAALIYYAGHGIQARGRNYLIPVDATLESETSLRFQAVDTGTLTDELEQAQSRVSFLILDACRNNPFERKMRGAARGLAPVDAAQGALIAYATAPGSVASDGEGSNGVYTAALLSALNEPGLKAEEVFKRVRIEVARMTKNQQTPWESSSLTGDFVFNFSPTPPAGVGPSVDREMMFWQSAQASNRSEEYEAYLAQYPQGAFAPLARSRIAAVRAQTPVESRHEAKPHISNPAPPMPKSAIPPSTAADPPTHLQVAVGPMAKPSVTTRTWVGRAKCSQSERPQFIDVAATAVFEDGMLTITFESSLSRAVFKVVDNNASGVLQFDSKMSDWLRRAGGSGAPVRLSVSDGAIVMRPNGAGHICEAHLPAK